MVFSKVRTQEPKCARINFERKINFKKIDARGKRDKNLNRPNEIDGNMARGVRMKWAGRKSGECVKSSRSMAIVTRIRIYYFFNWNFVWQRVHLRTEYFAPEIVAKQQQLN